MNADKPGYLTTEFWKSLAAIAVMLMMQFGFLMPEEGESFQKSMAKAIEFGAAAIAEALILVGYFRNRSVVKAVALQSKESLQPASMNMEVKT